MPDEYMGDMVKLGGWIRTNAEYTNNHVRELVKIAAQDLKADGCEFLFIIGHCWGVHLAIRAASEPEQVLLGVAGLHPTAVTVPLVANLKCPLALFPSMDDPDMVCYIGTWFSLCGIALPSTTDTSLLFSSYYPCRFQ